MIAVSHPTGNEFVRHLLKSLISNNYLHQYYTSVASFPNDLLHKIGIVSLVPELEKRVYDSALENLTTTFPSKEILRQISLKINAKNLVRHEYGPFCIDKIYHFQDKVTADKIKKTNANLAGIYAYEDGALHSFTMAKKLGLERFYDLPIGYWRLGMEILENEKNRRPEYASTLTGLANSPEKLHKKDLEIELATNIIVASSFTQNSLQLYSGNKSKIKLIPYGFPPTTTIEKPVSHKNTKLKVLYVGGITQRKGIAEVFDIGEKFKNHLQLTIIGKKTSFENKVIDENLKKFKWIPSLNHSEILIEMRSHDLLLFPSFFEGYGLVINEAMSQGTPVITTKNTGGGDCIEHGINGWLVEPGNTKEISEILEELILNREKLLEASLAARQTAKSRPWINYGDELADFLMNSN